MSDWRAAAEAEEREFREARRYPLSDADLEHIIAEVPGPVSEETMRGCIDRFNAERDGEIAQLRQMAAELGAR